MKIYAATLVVKENDPDSEEAEKLLDPIIMDLLKVELEPDLGEFKIPALFGMLGRWEGIEEIRSFIKVLSIHTK